MTTWYTSEEFSAGTRLPVVQVSEVGSDSRGNRKLKRLSVDQPTNSTLRRSICFESTSPVTSKGDFSHFCEKNGSLMRLSRLYDGKSRYPKMENMPHFHYDDIDLGSAIQVSLYGQSNEGEKRYIEEEEASFLVEVQCRSKSWILRRTADNFAALDKQIHRCLFDRKFSRLQPLTDTLEDSKGRESMDVREMLQVYLLRLSEIADNVINCGPVLNWFELDNRGNHLLLTDESAINVPGIAAAHVIKRYHSQAADEISLEVGDIISVIDMPPVDESVWWRGKRGFEVGFFPSQCVEVIGDYSSKLPLPASQGMHVAMKPVAKKRGKLISFLRLFLSSRPSRARLMQSGILKERTFGSDLGEHLAVTCKQVPLVLEKCAQVIEEHGIVDGIYRLSGSSSVIQKLRFLFDGDDPPELSQEYYLRDVHCISSLVKMYFRELPNPLLTYHLYDKFVSAIQITDDNERKVAIHHAVQQLPPPHYRTLEYLLRHLATVASHSPDTGMHAKNLAIVWAPNLLKPRSQEYGGAALLEINVQAIIVEYMIRNAAELFDRNAASIAIVSNPRYNTMQERGPHHRINSDTDLSAAGTLGPRLASISVSPAPKLISLEEARARATTVPSKPPPRPPPPRPPPPKTLDLQPSSEPYEAHPRRESESSGSTANNTGTMRSFKNLFSRSKSFNAASVTKGQDAGTFFFVSQDSEEQTSPKGGPADSPVSYAGESRSFEQESLRQAYSAEDLSASPPASEIVTVPRHATSVRIRSIMQGGQPPRPPRRIRSKAEVVHIRSKVLEPPLASTSERGGSAGSYSSSSSSGPTWQERVSVTAGSSDGSRERIPSGGDSSRERIPSGGDGSRERIPSGGDGFRERMRSGGGGSRERIPSGGDSSRERIPSGGDASRERIPSGGDSSRERVPSVADGSRKRMPSGGDGFRERTPSGGAQIRRHPVLTSFSKMSSEKTMFVSKVEYNRKGSLRGSARRASTGNQTEIDRRTPKDEAQPTEHRPLSVYDNRPASVYENEPTTQKIDTPSYRYSSPVISTGYRPEVIPEDARYSCPVGTPPLPRAYKRRPNGKFSVTGARLAQSHAV